jgi:hypothetical protein
LYDIRRFELRHDEAILAICEILKKEFIEGQIINFGGRSGEKRDTSILDWESAHPDIIVLRPGNFKIIVEVGSTDAEKITFYLQQETVEEVRWYDRFCILVAQWLRNRDGAKSTQVQIEKVVNFQRDEIRKREERILKLTQDVSELKKKLTGKDERLKKANGQIRELQRRPESRLEKEEKEYIRHRKMELRFRGEMLEKYRIGLKECLNGIGGQLLHCDLEHLFFLCPECFEYHLVAEGISYHDWQKTKLMCMECNLRPVRQYEIDQIKVIYDDMRREGLLGAMKRLRDYYNETEEKGKERKDAQGKTDESTQEEGR